MKMQQESIILDDGVVKIMDPKMVVRAAVGFCNNIMGFKKV
jgi:hypothetical protein